MQKSKWYAKTRFSPEVLREAAQVFVTASSCEESERGILETASGDESWHFDTPEEFYAAARDADTYTFTLRAKAGELRVMLFETGNSQVSIGLDTRASIESVFEPFERNLGASKLVVEREPVKIFIGHGQDPQWRDLKDHLHDLHGLDVVAYEIGPRAGLSVKDVLQEMLTDSSFALLVLTAEDEQTDGSLHARQNVVHELGLFQGRLGFTRAVALLESGVTEFSNILGVNQIRFSKGHIRETFGDVVATIRREFGESA